MAAEAPAVDEDGGLPVHGPEVQQDPPVAPCLWNENVRRYQSLSSGLSGFITPDSADSMGYGTRMFPSNRTGACSSAFAVTAYCHRPLRFCHRCRTIWGRGYSGSALAGETSHPGRQQWGVVRDFPFRPRCIARSSGQKSKCGKCETAMLQTAGIGLDGEVGNRIVWDELSSCPHRTRAMERCHPSRHAQGRISCSTSGTCPVGFHDAGHGRDCRKQQN